MRKPVHSQEVKESALNRLKERGVTLDEITKIVYELQVVYKPDLDLALCRESVEAVLEKREVQHAILVGIELDILAEKGMLSQPLQSIIETDEGLFGCDETLALGSVFGYGSIAVTTFGYLDKEKKGIIRKLNDKNSKSIHTFLDDIVASIAASAASRLAHRLRDDEEKQEISAKKEQAG